MEKQRGAPVRIAFGRHVHIGYVEPLAPARDHEHVYWVRIGEALERNTERLVGQSDRSSPSRSKPVRHVATTGTFRIAARMEHRTLSYDFD
jgi:hypothetical protein